LAYYSDDVRALDPVLAPRDWQCLVTVGADGGTSVEVFAPNIRDADRAEISAVSDSACQGCVFDTVCALVPNAAADLHYQSVPCSHVRPAAEHVIWLKGSPQSRGDINDIVAFEDPPGVMGDGLPSGGRNPADGVLLYQVGEQGGQASSETCTMPQTQHSLCTAILNDFSNQNWLM
jgi:hypothetical protein